MDPNRYPLRSRHADSSSRSLADSSGSAGGKIKGRGRSTDKPYPTTRPPREDWLWTGSVTPPTNTTESPTEGEQSSSNLRAEEAAAPEVASQVNVIVQPNQLKSPTRDTTSDMEMTPPAVNTPVPTQPSTPTSDSSSSAAPELAFSEDPSEETFLETENTPLSPRGGDASGTIIVSKKKRAIKFDEHGPKTIKIGDHSIITTGITTQPLSNMVLASMANPDYYRQTRNMLNSDTITFDIADNQVIIGSILFSNEPGHALPAGVPIAGVALQAIEPPVDRVDINMCNITAAPARKTGYIEEEAVITYLSGGTVNDRAVVSAIQPKLKMANANAAKFLTEDILSSRTYCDNYLMYAKLFTMAMTIEVFEQTGAVLAAVPFDNIFAPVFVNLDDPQLDYNLIADPIRRGAIIFVDGEDYLAQDLQIIHWLTQQGHRLDGAVPQLTPSCAYIKWPGFDVVVLVHGGAPLPPPAQPLTSGQLYGFINRVTGFRSEHEASLKGLYTATDMIGIQYHHVPAPIPAPAAPAPPVVGAPPGVGAAAPAAAGGGIAAAAAAPVAPLVVAPQAPPPLPPRRPYSFYLTSLTTRSPTFPRIFDYNVLLRLLGVKPQINQEARRELEAYFNLTRLERVRAFAFYTAAFSTFVTTILYNYNITVNHLILWAQAAPGQQLSNLIRSALTTMAQPYYDNQSEPAIYIQAKRAFDTLLGFRVCEGIYISSPWLLPEGQGHDNALAAYADLNPNHPPRITHPLAIDSMLLMRPVEWGVGGPDTKVDLSSEIIGVGQGVNRQGLRTCRGDKTYDEVAKSNTPCLIVPYGALIMNAVCNDFRWLGLPQITFSVADWSPGSQPEWSRPEAQLALLPAYHGGTHTLEPCTLMTYSDDNTLVAAPALIGAALAAHERARLQQWRGQIQPRVGFHLNRLRLPDTNTNPVSGILMSGMFAHMRLNADSHASSNSGSAQADVNALGQRPSLNSQ